MLLFDVTGKISDFIMKFLCSFLSLLRKFVVSFLKKLSALKKKLISCLERNLIAYIFFSLILGAIFFYFESPETIATHIFEIIGVIAIPFALMHERNEMKEQQKEMHQHQKIMKDQQDTMHQQLKILEKQEILNAWMILNTRTPGNGGKRDALEFLAKADQILDRIDLSSQTNGGNIYLGELYLNSEYTERAISIMGSKFDGTI